MSGLGAAVVAALERSPLLGCLPTETLDRVLSLARLRTLRRGAGLMHEGLTDDHVHLVVTGHVKRHRLAADDREVILGIAGPGVTLGLVEVLDGGPARHGATALSTTDVLSIGGSAIRRAFDEDATVGVSIARVLVLEVRRGESELVRRSGADARTRVASRLIELAESERAGGGPGVPLSQEELAAWASVSRESAAKVLHELRHRSIVRTGRRRITVDDLEGLREIVAAGGERLDASTAPPHPVLAAPAHTFQRG